MASIVRTVTGHAKDMYDRYRKAPMGGTNKGDANSNEMLKPAPYGSSGMSAPAPSGTSAAGPKGDLAKDSLSISPMGGNKNSGRGKFPNMVKDMK